MVRGGQPLSALDNMRADLSQAGLQQRGRREPVPEFPQAFRSSHRLAPKSFEFTTAAGFGARHEIHDTEQPLTIDLKKGQSPGLRLDRSGQRKTGGMGLRTHSNHQNLAIRWLRRSSYPNAVTTSSCRRLFEGHLYNVRFQGSRLRVSPILHSHSISPS